ncbi:MAG: AsnC family transcriptional regulator [Nitrosopumilales archaeon CG15_BIG_FIL_POST_REV_8_21_14_020_33_23]|nr:MAG: AsnC family transcriptional regulator [Nitrosopumilales archaeon CG15_BIG_FIL_POST_REV_8_21_14_020_33_23]PIY88299.1 MAG: AsnC family transcriptional regulator [Nitrosopumilales archaeon CG_4_10_14_0_8_um_filter_34_8]PJB98811.1 MAG: AsnC family transcriptional regulator [Nitrosopumilales archaeon CG_4_9_14_0_8_um_filter_34_10]
MAFVLLGCGDEVINEVVSELKTIDSVKEYVRLNSNWKIIIKLEGDIEQIREIIRWKIRKMENIESTLTLIEYMD